MQFLPRNLLPVEQILVSLYSVCTLCFYCMILVQVRPYLLYTSTVPFDNSERYTMHAPFCVDVQFCPTLRIFLFNGAVGDICQYSHKFVHHDRSKTTLSCNPVLLCTPEFRLLHSIHRSCLVSYSIAKLRYQASGITVSLYHFSEGFFLLAGFLRSITTRI
jgi:hypothetical protein